MRTHETAVTVREVEWCLYHAGLSYAREVCGTADWSVQAWDLGADVYLCADDDFTSFSLVHRDAQAGDEIEEILNDAPLQLVVERACEVLR